MSDLRQQKTNLEPYPSIPIQQWIQILKLTILKCLTQQQWKQFQWFSEKGVIISLTFKGHRQFGVVTKDIFDGDINVPVNLYNNDGNDVMMMSKVNTAEIPFGSIQS